jgi:hypothetical protein
LHFVSQICLSLQHSKPGSHPCPFQGFGIPQTLLGICHGSLADGNLSVRVLQVVVSLSSVEAEFLGLAFHIQFPKAQLFLCRADGSAPASEQIEVVAQLQSAVESVAAEIWPGLLGGLPGSPSLKVELALLIPDCEFSAGTYLAAGVHLKIQVGIKSSLLFAQSGSALFHLLLGDLQNLAVAAGEVDRLLQGN